MYPPAYYGNNYGREVSPYKQENEYHSRGRSRGRYMEQRSGRPSDHLFLAVFTTICCFHVLGFIAVIFSHLSRFKFIEGDYERARFNGNVSMWLSVIGIILGLILYILLIILFAAPWVFFGDVVPEYCAYLPC